VARAKALSSEEADGAGDPFSDDDDFERVRLFGKNNQRAIPQPWSDEEKLVFIDMMRGAAGEERYEQIADRLDRSLEEIFAFAKDLQESMDAAHEKGMMNEACDEWTYRVWVQPH